MEVSKIKSVFLLVALAFLFFGCSVTKQNTITLNTKKVIFAKPFQVRSVSLCLDDSYASFEEHTKYGKLFVEYIKLSSRCTYNGSFYSFFTYLFKSELKLKNMKLVEQLEFDNFSFYTFRINDNSYVNMIFKYTVTEDMVIVDYQGKLSNELIKNYKKSYESKYLNEKRFDKKFDRSLARMNYFNSYFQREKIIR